jgi:hypothetical protein
MTTDRAMVRFYEWCLRDAIAEHESGFPFVEIFRGSGARNFLYIAGGLNETEQRELLLALLRRHHSKALVLKGELLSEIDMKWISYVMQDRIIPAGGDQPNRPGELSDKMLTASELARRIKTLPLPVRPINIYCASGTISFDLNRGDMIIHTWLDVGGRSRHVTIDHALIDSSGKRLIDGENPIRWLGIGTARWNHVRLAAVEMIVDSIAQSVRRFEAAVDYVVG